jgi:Phage integrase family
MAGRQAKILHEQQINDLLVFASATRNPLRHKLMVMLSVKAGLRAGEFAGLTWDMVLDPTGEVGQVLELTAGVLRTAERCMSFERLRHSRIGVGKATEAMEVQSPAMEPGCREFIAPRMTIETMSDR